MKPVLNALRAGWRGLVAGALLAALCGLAQATSYSASAVAANASSYPFVDISSSGAPLTLGDNAVSGALAIGFSFNYGGTAYTTLKVQSNGMLLFGASSTAATNAALPLDGSSGKPTLDAVMLPLWDDLAPTTPGQVRTLTQGTAPNRVFIVSWASVPYACTANGSNGSTCAGGQTVSTTATFQVQLYEQGQFVYSYGTVDGNGGAHNASGGFTNAAGATVGFQVNSSDYVQFSRNTSAETANTTVVWTPVVLIAEYRFEESYWNGSTGELNDSAGYSGGPFNGKAQGSAFPTAGSSGPARSGDPGTCGYANLPGPVNNGAGFTVPALPLQSATGAQTTTLFWMYWDGTDGVIVLSFDSYDLYLSGGSFGFNTNNSDVYGIASSGLANGWHHVAAVFSIGSVTSNKLYIDGAAQTLTQRAGSPNLSRTVMTLPLRFGGYGPSAGFRFKGRFDELRVYNGAVSAGDVQALYTLTHSCAALALPPSGFNAFDTATAAGSVTGNVKTKISGASFSAAVVAVNKAGTSPSNSFSGPVKVELLDSSDNSGAFLSGAAGASCRSSWVVLPGSSATMLSFAASDQGRSSIALSEANAWKDVRVRITSPASGTAQVTGCSTDNFSLRPSAFTGLSATDADWQTAGSTRNLGNVAASGGAVHKAGVAFTVKASAVNAAGTPAVTSNYVGTPAAVLSACSGSGCPSSFGTLTLGSAASAGVLNANSATYSEAGGFNLQLVDSTFAAVDTNDGSTTTERYIVSAVLPVGRFVPDHFDLTTLVTPQLRTFGSNSCAARSFTYVGQPFGWATAPQAAVLARNAAGATLANYSGAMWKLTAGSLAQSYTPLASATPGLDSSGIGSAALTNNGNGSGAFTAAAADTLKIVRSASTPLAPFNAAIGLSWSVTDTSEAAVSGNGSIGTATPLLFSSIGFDAGNGFRYGLLKLGSAYGSELIALAAPLEAQYWDGQRFATNSADNCSTLAAANVTLGNYQRNLSACKTALSPSSLTLAAGRAWLRLAAPGAGNYGSVDASLNLGSSASGQTCSAVGGSAVSAVAASLGWLQGRSAGTLTFDQNPAARIGFGPFKAPLVHLRESF